MKRTITFLSKEIALAAVQDAPNFSIADACLQENDGKIEVSFALCDLHDEDKAPASVTWADMDSLYSAVRREMEYEMKWLREDLNYYFRKFEEHMKGHLPPILDAGKMEGAIKALGMSDSYEVKKVQVFVQY